MHDAILDIPGERIVDEALGLLRNGHADAALARLNSRPPHTADVSWFAALGVVHLAAGNHADALPALRAAVALGDASPNGMMNLALAEDRVGDTTRARQLMQELRNLLPRWDEPPLRQAESFRRNGEIALAEQAYRDALDANAGRPEALIGLAALLVGRSEPVQAQMLLLRCCDAVPDSSESWDLLGISLMMTEDFPAAESAFAVAQQLAPADDAIALRRVEAAVAAGTATQELARLEAADPLDAVLLTARAALLDRLGRRAEAIDVLEVAVTLYPDMLSAARAKAQLLVRANRIAEALPALEHAVALAPDDLDLQNNQAAALVRLQRHQQGREILERLIETHGEHPGLLCNLTNALISLGLHTEGFGMAERAVELDPASSLSWRTMCNALPYCDGIGGAALLRATRRVGETLDRNHPAIFANNPDPRRRLRLGLLSSSLKTHPVGWLTASALEMLDPAEFEIVCVGPTHGGDAIERRFRVISAGWDPTDRYAGPAETIRGIRDLDLDIMIDLSGYGDQGLMALCAERLAPVQVKWVGSQSHSTGLAEMDWFITDRWETPAGFDRFYSERLLRLPDGYVCYGPPSYAPEVAPLPAMQNGRVTFGCFNNLAKVTDRVIAAWAGILGELPDSRLVLKCHQMAEPATRARLLGAFAELGIAASRIELRASSSHRDLLGQYNDIDIALDPFPYSGGLTTCEALWMGVPTVTLPGETFSSRHAASHLSNVGLADWVAGNVADYQKIALQKASDLQSLSALRRDLRPMVKASPLCDAPRFGRHLAEALRHVWNDWCARR